MRTWLSVFKGLVAVGLVAAVLGILFIGRGMSTEVSGGQDDKEWWDLSGEVGDLLESESDIWETKVQDGQTAQDSQTTEESGTGQMIVETYTATPVIVETYIAGMESQEMPAINILWQELTLSEQELLDRGKVVYLTFDDGPTKYTAELLDILAKYNVKATFFVTAGYPDYADIIGRAKSEGHTIGIHCFNHDYKKVYAGERAYFADFQMIDDLIFEQTGERAQLVRFPGGSSNEVSRFNKGIMTRLTRLVEEKGYRYFDWNVLSGDAGETKSTEKIIQNIKEGILKKDIAVVLQHDMYDYSVAAVEEVIVWGLENGYVFLPLTMDSPTIHHPIAN